jgi:competence protein ComEC
VRAPAALAALPLVFGSACGLIVAERVPSGFAFAAAGAACLALVGALGALAHDDDPQTVGCLVVGVLTTGLSLGVTGGISAYRSPLSAIIPSSGFPTAPLVLDGVLREDAGVSATGVSIVVDVEHVRPCDPGVCRGSSLGGARLSVVGSQAISRVAEWRAGRSVRVTASLRAPTVYRDPGVPDESRALARRGIAVVGSVKSADLVEITGRASPLNELAASFRAWTRATLATFVGCWSARSAGVASAIIIGDRSGLLQEDERRLQAAGTYHVIAISGGNIAIFTTLLLMMVRVFAVPRRLGASATIAVLLFYGRITGAAASVDRAIAAAVLYLGGRLLDHQGAAVNLLAIAAVIALAVSPAAVFDPGFILSFGATLGILILVPKIVGHGTPTGGLWFRAALHAAFMLFAATLAAEIALAPAGAAMFGRMTAAGLLLNFAAIPLMAIVQGASLVTLAASLFDASAARACGYVVDLASRGLVDSARLVDVAPWLTRDVPAPAWWLLAAYYAAVIVGLTRLQSALVARAVAIVTAAMIAIGPRALTRDGIAPPPAGTLRIVFLDVGQGDATAILFPDGRSYLVDAGGLPAAPLQDPADSSPFDLGNRVIVRALRTFGVVALDTFVLTHADPDHIGGATSVIRALGAHAVWEGIPVPSNLPTQALRATAITMGAEWRTVQAGDRLFVRDVEIRALHPRPPDWERQRVRNDDSIVLAIRLGDVSIILPGDIGREGEADAIEHLHVATPLTILKAPHHGSATSSTREFLEALHPAAVVFSAGRANRFGHPAPPVVERYRSLGATLFSTADDGAVILDTDGHRVRIHGWATTREVRFEAKGDRH